MIVYAEVTKDLFWITKRCVLKIKGFLTRSVVLVWFWSKKMIVDETIFTYKNKSLFIFRL